MITPGPWKVYEGIVDRFGIITVPNTYCIMAPTGYMVVGSVPHGDPIRNKDDANVIAAAPELLAACQAVVKFFDARADVGYASPADLMLDEVRAAIKKARGE